MLLSIDVGIKNLAYCLFENPEKIIDWNVINLCDKHQQQQSLCTQTNCKFKAKFKAPKTLTLNTDDSLDIFYCMRHAKKSRLFIPSRNTSKTVINAMRVSELREFALKYNISSTSTPPQPQQPQPSSMSKPALAEMINLFILNNSLLPCDQRESSKNISLIDIGISMKEKFDIIFSKHIQHISTIIIENQISPIAGRLKTLQGMIAQYFIMHCKTDIRFVSASNKLKGYDVDIEYNKTDTSNNIIEPKDGYNMRKMASVRITGELISSKFPEWTNIFKTHKKLDDLSDAFLQGMWFNSIV